MLRYSDHATDMKPFSTAGEFFPHLPEHFDRVDLSQEQSMKKKGDRTSGPPGNGLRVASFFSGGGGLDLGFRAAGFDVVFCNEIETVFCQTLSRNFAENRSTESKILCADIRELD